MPVSVPAERAPLRLLASVNLTANRAGCVDGPPPAGQGAAELPSTQPTNFTDCTDSCPVRELARMSQRRIRAGHAVSLLGWSVISSRQFPEYRRFYLCASMKCTAALSEAKRRTGVKPTLHVLGGLEPASKAVRRSNWWVKCLM